MTEQFLEFSKNLNLSFFGSFILLVASNLIALFIAQVIFPFKLKSVVWKWEKRIKAKEDFVKSISRMDFITRCYIDGEQDNKFSLAGLSLIDTEKEVLEIIRNLHNEGQNIRPYLSKYEKCIFDDFIKLSSQAYNDAKENYGQWYPDDQMAEELHSLDLIQIQSKIACKILKKIL